MSQLPAWPIVKECIGDLYEYKYLHPSVTTDIGFERGSRERLFLCAAQTRARSARQPNFVLILADDLGHGDVGAYGSKIVPAPHLDRLAREGVRFTNGYVTASICSPSCAALMTGRYQARFGHDFNPAGIRDPNVASLPRTEKTIAERMRAVGYKTGLVGKWHLGLEGEYHPLARGFDEFWGYNSEAAFIQKDQPGDERFGIQGEANLRGRKNRYWRGREPVEDDGYLTEVTTREALSFINRHKTEPFFLLVTHHAPHVPLEATRQYLDRVKSVSDRGQRVYAAMVAALDDGVGAIVAKLDELKLAQNTFVVFTSDNGCASYVNGACTNAPLNGFKRDQLEGGIRVPMIARYPSALAVLGKLKAGQVFDAPVISLDLMATALALGGADLKSAPLDGTDLLPYLTGKAKGMPHQQLFWRAGENYAVREGDWKLWVAQTPKGGSETFLFDLKKDVSEKQNLAAQYPQIVARLKAAFASWNAGNIAPRFAPRTTDVTVNGVPVRLAF